MKARPLYVIIAALFICVALASCKKDEEGLDMTLTINVHGITGFCLKGEGTAIVNWGDGSPNLEKPIEPDRYTSFSYDYSEENIRTIKIYGNKVTALYCDYLDIADLDVSKNTALTELDLFRCQLLDLDVSKNLALTILICWGPEITSLDLSKNLALKKLWCVFNQLTSLDVSNNLALTDLSCSSNPLWSLDVSKNTALKNLSCSDTYITVLDVSKNTALTNLGCTYNRFLTNLDVSKNTALTLLYCSANQLTSLDVTNNTVLCWVACANNIFSTEALDDLFGTLHSNAIQDKKIYVQDNPGSETCNSSIATEKGWIIETRPGTSVI